MMELIVEGIADGGAIPERFAFGVADSDSHVRLGENLNPALRWRKLPEGTHSLALICVDTDVPTRPDDVNQEGRTVPASLPRGRFYHWVMVDIPPDTKGIEEGQCSRGVEARGKQSPEGPAGSRQGRNDYTSWFDGDAEMGGVYLGYDGPCPPWNDSIPHHYQFVLYATDLERCPVEGAFTGEDVETALTGHVLARAELTGVYSLNPDVPPK
jgi:Raf kinase inhibitor-like YbhB/YbcL family protein